MFIADTRPRWRRRKEVEERWKKKQRLENFEELNRYMKNINWEKVESLGLFIQKKDKSYEIKIIKTKNCLFSKFSFFFGVVVKTRKLYATLFS